MKKRKAGRPNRALEQTDRQSAAKGGKKKQKRNNDLHRLSKQKVQKVFGTSGKALCLSITPKIVSVKGGILLIWRNGDLPIKLVIVMGNYY